MARSNEEGLAAIARHEQTMQSIMVGISEEFRGDVYNSMVLEILTNSGNVSEEKLKEVAEKCIKDFSYSGHIYSAEPYYDPYDSIDTICDKFTLIVNSQAERAARITAAVNLLVTI